MSIESPVDGSLPGIFSALGRGVGWEVMAGENSGEGGEGDEGVGEVGEGVLAGEVEGEDDAVVVAGVDDEHAVADGAEAVVLGLVSADEEFGPPESGEGLEDGLGLVAAPDELVDGAGALVVFFGELAGEKLGVELGEVAGAGEGMGEEDAGVGDGGEGLGVEEFAECEVDVGGIFSVEEFDVAVEAVGEVVAVFHDGEALDLGHVVVGEDEVDLAGEFGGELEGGDEEVEGGVFAAGAEGAAVDDFLEEDVALGIFGEVGGFDDAFEVAGMGVDVAGDEEVAMGGEAEHLGIAQGVSAVVVSGNAEEVDKFFSLQHGLASGVRGRVGQVG